VFKGKNGARGKAALGALALAAAAAFFLLGFSEARAQGQRGTYQPLSVKEKNFLLRMAQEPVDALLKGRRPRDLRAPASMARLNQSQRLALTIYLDGQFLCRAWELRTPGVLQATMVSLSHRILEAPDAGRPPTYDEMSRISMSVAVLHDLKEVPTDKQITQGQAVLATVGMDFALGLPSDLGRPHTPFDLLSKACELSGLRSGAWLGDKANLFSSEVEEFSGS
jgi:hypothetical protein